MRKHFRAGALVALLASTALVATACPPPTTGGPPTASRTFRANVVTVESSNDGCWLVCPYKDEPKVIHVGFRAKVGVPNSAQVQVSIGANHWNGVFQQGPGEGGSHTYLNNEAGILTFNNISMPDVLDLVAGAPLEVVGVWAWKVEDDGILAANVNNMANAIAQALTPVLNQTIAMAALPSDANQIVNTVLSTIGNLGFFNLVATGLTALMNNLNIASDDVVGSGIYVGIGSSGTLAEIIDGATNGVAFPAIAIPSVRVPPDIGGGSIFSLNTARNFSNNWTNGSVDGRHRTTYSFG